MQQRPRTATVVATSAGVVYVASGPDFLAAVNATAPLSAAFGDLAAARVRESHPGR